MKANDDMGNGVWLRSAYGSLFVVGEERESFERSEMANFQSEIWAVLYRL